MSLTPEEVLQQLETYGITTLDELAQQVSKQTVAHAEFVKALDIPRGRETSDYVWSGGNYSLYHPEK